MVKILYAEDNPMLQVFMEALLDGIEGCLLICVDDGVSALEYLKKNDDIALLITDWDMPRMNGLDLTSAVRSDQSLAHLPIIMTSDRSPQDVLRAREAGINEFIPKPASREVIRQVLCRLLA